MKKITSSLLGAVVLAALINPTVYANSSDVGLVNRVFDKEKEYQDSLKNTPLNNFRREITAQYKADGLEVKANDPNGPLTLEGDRVTYNTVDGDYEGQGNMKVTHNFSRVEAEEIKGNTKAGQIKIDTPAEFLQLADPKVDLKSGTTEYDYQTRKGKLTKVEGRIDTNYVKGEVIELDAGNYTMYDGIITRCSSEKPPYYIEADKVVVTPELATFYNPRFILYGKTIYKQDKYEIKLNQPRQGHRKDSPSFPFKLRYSNDNGVTLGYFYDHKLMDKLFAYAEINYSTKRDFHNIYGVTWENGPSVTTVESGKYEDNDNRWLKKKYSFMYNYGRRIADTAYSFNFFNEYGLWREDGIEAHHREHNLTLWRDPIPLDRSGDLQFYPSVGYKIIKVDVPGGDKKGLHYSGVLVNKFNPKVVGYLGYHYSRTDAQNTVFKFGENDFSKEVSLGAGVQITPLDRIIVATEFDASKSMSLQHLDYYWYHDFKFVSSELRYEQKDKRVSLHFDFYDF